MMGYRVLTDRGEIWIYRVLPARSGPGLVKDEGRLRLYLASYQRVRGGKPVKIERHRQIPRHKLWGTFDTAAELWAAWLGAS